MHIRSTTFLLVTALGLAACGDDAPSAPDAPPVTPTTEPAAAAEPAGPAGSDRPAGEVAADSRTPADPAAADGSDAEEASPMATGTALLAPDAAWQPMLDTGIPFVFGVNAGLAAAKKAGKPAMLVYAATW